MPLGAKVCLSPGHIVLHGDPAHPQRGTAPPKFLVDVYYGQTVTHLSYCWALVVHVRDIGTMLLAIKELQMLVKQVVNVIWRKGCIAVPHGLFNGIRRVAPMCNRCNTCFLGPRVRITQTASRSVQPFLHSSPQSVHILYHSPPFFPQSCFFPWGDPDPHMT